MKYEQLLKAGVHFGHLTRKWHPKMAPYIFMERDRIHIIDLHKTIRCLQEATDFVKRLSNQNKKILFVGTKIQAKDVVYRTALSLRMPYVTERWLGGMLTNFTTMRRAMRRMKSVEKLMREPAYQNLAKRERLMLQRDKDKRENILGGIMDLTRPPDALFIVDIKKERIALQEALRLNIPIIAMVDTNSSPIQVDYPIPSNDDAITSIETITRAIADAITEGAQVRKAAQKEAIKASEENKLEASKDEAAKASSSAKEASTESSSPFTSTKRRRLSVATPTSTSESSSK